jgi:hypothetical protein
LGEERERRKKLLFYAFFKPFVEQQTSSELKAGGSE